MSSKFKVGDRIRFIKDDFAHKAKVGEETIIKSVLGEKVSFENGGFCYLDKGPVFHSSQHFELVTNKRGRKMSEPKKHLYRLKKDTLGTRKGAIVIEDCDDGTQDFHLLEEFESYMKDTRYDGVFFRTEVVDNPEWFEEVTVEYVPVGPTKRTYKKRNKSRRNG